MVKLFENNTVAPHSFPPRECKFNFKVSIVFEKSEAH